MISSEDNFKRKVQIEQQLDGMIDLLRELLKCQKAGYEPYNEKQTKLAIRALLNIRGLKK